MLVRLFALLLAAGMIVISGYGAAELATPDATVLVEETDDLSDTGVTVSPAVLSDPEGARRALASTYDLTGHRPEVVIFRPPRGAAFA